jgi:hypothetical protein
MRMTRQTLRISDLKCLLLVDTANELLLHAYMHLIFYRHL